MKKLLFIICVALISCHEESELISAQSLLTNNSVKKWQVISISDMQNGVFGTCNGDDIWSFKLYDEELGQPVWAIEDNYISCGSDYIWADGFWRINNQENRIILTVGDTKSGENANLVLSILKLTENEMILTFTEERSSNFESYRIQINFIAI